VQGSRKHKNELKSQCQFKPLLISYFLAFIQRQVHGLRIAEKNSAFLQPETFVGWNHHLWSSEVRHAWIARTALLVSD
jgi:hypothetical protein